MPSDARTQRALEALADHRTRYRSAVSAAHDQMASYLAAHRTRTHGQAQTAARELGQFAAGRIDAARFGALFTDAHVLSTETTERVERLVGVLAGLLAEGDGLFTCDVPPGGDMHAAVDHTIAQAGRVFGAVLAFQALKTGTYRPERHDEGVRVFPFAHWNRNERRLSLPLVVEVDGADLRAEALAEYLDGRVAVVVVVRGASAPAPLARLVTPGMLVVQTCDASELRLLADYDGPAIAALVPADAAQFVHDPRAGRSLHSRLRIVSVPADGPKHPLGARSAWQQCEELAQLRELLHLRAVELSTALATVPDAPAISTAGLAGMGVTVADDRAVDRLTDWLLAEAGLGAPTNGAGGSS